MLIKTSLYTLRKAFTSRMGLPLTEIVKCLQSIAPLPAAAEWDNVGLLVDPMTDKPIGNVLLTNDLTEAVVNEAVDNNVGLIVSYHPNIFKPLKRLTAGTWKERIVVQCIRHEIAVFSPHTSWDNSPGGVSDWLASMFAFKSVDPIQTSGRLVTLQTPLSVSTVVEKIKSHTGIPHVQLALACGKTLDSLVSSVALCAGSGGSVLQGVQADLFWTGEMSHHEVLDAAQSGVHVVLCNHSNTERGFLPVFKNKLGGLLGGEVNVIVSRVDRDPLVTV